MVQLQQPQTFQTFSLDQITIATPCTAPMVPPPADAIMGEIRSNGPAPIERD
ncbi:MAG: hypothetical protein ACR2GY_06860 [Phycisphaerales bacterium]